MVQAVAPSEPNGVDAASVCAAVERAAGELEALVASVDPHGWGPDDALRLLAWFARAGKAAAAGQTFATARVDESDACRRAGHRTTADLVAARAGTSIGHAHVIVETARSLDDRRATADALRAGRLSVDQAHAVAVAANAVPTAEAELLALAATAGLGGLRRRARDVKLAAEMNAPGYYERMVAARSLRHWTDASGMTAGTFRLPPDIGAMVTSVLEAQADRCYRAAPREQRHREGHDRFVADAFVALVTGRTPEQIHRPGSAPPTGTEATPTATSPPPGRPPRAEIVVHVSYDALRRGRVEPGEYSLVQGVGPIPVARVDALLDDAFLKGVLVDGTEIAKVVHFGRRIPAEVRTALVARSIVRDGEVVCVEEGCDATQGLEWDHVRPVHRGGPTTLDNIKPRCAPDHREKSRGELRRRDGPAP